jgi:hypothetical protein
MDGRLRMPLAINDHSTQLTLVIQSHVRDSTIGRRWYRLRLAAAESRAWPNQTEGGP